MALLCLLGHAIPTMPHLLPGVPEPSGPRAPERQPSQKLGQQPISAWSAAELWRPVSSDIVGLVAPKHLKIMTAYGSGSLGALASICNTSEVKPGQPACWVNAASEWLDRSAMCVIFAPALGPTLRLRRVAADTSLFFSQGDRLSAVWRAIFVG